MKSNRRLGGPCGGLQRAPTRERPYAGVRFDVWAALAAVPGGRPQGGAPTPACGPPAFLVRTVCRCPAAALLVFGACTSALACGVVIVRDAPFSDERDMHRLCLFTSSGDPRGTILEDRLAAWLVGEGSGTNIELHRVNADDPTVEWSDYGVPAAPPAMPVVMFAGYSRTDDRAFYVRHWEPAPSEADLAALADSPVRAALRSELGKRIAVLLHSPGTEGDSEGVRAVLDKVAANWSRKERLGVSVLTLDRVDEREKTLLSFLDVKPEGPDWVAVVFGRGKLMAPHVGEDIQEGFLDDQLRQLTADCTCLTDASGLGVDMPLLWTGADDAEVLPSRDPEEIEDSALAGLDSGIGIGAVTSTLWTLAGLAAAMALGGAALVWRRHRFDAAPSP